MTLHAIDKLEMFLEIAPAKAAAAAQSVGTTLADQCELAALARLDPRVGDVLAEPKRPVREGNGEVIAVPSELEGWLPGSPFILFEERFKNALVVGGLASPRAAMVAGALNEIADNAFQHANAAIAHATFEVQDRRWAFSVTDNGRGIPASVSSVMKVDDDVAAMKQALVDGWSRTGDPLRGRGFTQLLKVLADRNCEIRLRSGSAAGFWSGPSPTAQAIYFQALTFRQGAHVRVSCLSDVDKRL